jgi:hypothetical protein
MNNNFALPQNHKFLLGQFLGLQEFLQAETAETQPVKLRWSVIHVRQSLEHLRTLLSSGRPGDLVGSCWYLLCCYSLEKLVCRGQVQVRKERISGFLSKECCQNLESWVQKLETSLYVGFGWIEGKNSHPASQIYQSVN